MQGKQLDVGINHNHAISTKTLINTMANLVMICRFTYKLLKIVFPY